MTTPSKPLITIGFWIVAVGTVIAAIAPPILAVADQMETVVALDFSKYAVGAGAIGLGLIGIGKALWDVGHKLSAAAAAGGLPTDLDQGDAGPGAPPQGAAPAPAPEG